MGTVYKFVRNPEEKEKLAPQARAVLKHIEAAGKKGIAKHDLVKKLEEDQKEGRFETRQTVAKIIGFYQPIMLESGFIEVEKHEEPKKEKPAKEAPKGKTVAEAKAS